MAIAPQSIRKGIIIKFDGEVVDKKVVLSASESWNDNHQILFKEQLAKLQAAIIAKDNNFLFYIPSVTNPKAIGGGYISMKPDF